MNERLDALLAEWAVENALPESRARAIRDLPRTAAPGPSVRWWKERLWAASASLPRPVAARRAAT
jgi:hypothetical protein